MRMLWRSGLPAKYHGPPPLELVGKGPPSIAQVIGIVPWFCDYPKQGWKCQQVYIQYEESGLSCAQRGCAV